MSIESNKKNESKKRNKSLDLNFKYFKIYIQCPYCGDVIKINPERKYLCRSCDHIFTENELREKCGL